MSTHTSRYWLSLAEKEPNGGGTQGWYLLMARTTALVEIAEALKGDRAHLQHHGGGVGLGCQDA